ncbi:MAG: SufD family Fe-S cluster assembly protein [Mycoplasmoidaceae bacterium]|nr:SufD family Fe-S cluster assembly protein [Mycoplasmoidaceae bacterium]
MLSNIFLKNLNDTENINLKDGQMVNVYLVSNDQKDITKTINLNLRNNNVVNLYCLALSNAKSKVININFNHLGDHSISNIFVKALANNHATIKVNCVSLCKAKTHKNIINQTIDGLIFDNDSLIQALPCLDINIDDIEAKHTVNIGQIDPEIIFYLNTKGLNKLEAYQFLIDSFINDLDPYLTKHNININKDIKLLMGGKYE